MTQVAPFTGAWIEISTCRTFPADCPVAPFTGAWIEICCLRPSEGTERVAPFTGAWIEINSSLTGLQGA